MQLHLLRNATLRLHYAGRTLLIDPMLGPVHTFRSLAGREENPTAPLPLPAEDAVRGLDGVIVSHLHPDHFDEAACCHATCRCCAAAGTRSSSRVRASRRSRP